MFPLGHGLAPKSGAARAARAVAGYRNTLDPDGRLARFSSQPAERENGRGQSLQEGRRRALLLRIIATGLRRFGLGLESGRLWVTALPRRGLQWRVARRLAAWVWHCHCRLGRLVGT